MIFTTSKHIQFIILGLAAVAGVSACSPSKPVSELTSPTNEIISDRPIKAVPDLFVVILSQPALLTVAEKTPNGLQIPAAARDAVMAQQTDFEEKLKAISSDIHIVYRYRLALNGFAIYAPAALIPQMNALPGVTKISSARRLERPEQESVGPAPKQQKGQVNSVNFIGADMAHSLGYTGRGMRVGVIDTGIDYTHRMLGGSGNPEDYQSIDPAQPTARFPNAKVVGGTDLVGSTFNAASPFERDHLPHPDDNPLDEAGHGTHVAGTVAGVGDGINSYSGVAPGATLYAIKVFGKDGATMDASVIAGLEYAADPNRDLQVNDRLHVVNLSLGGGYGQPQILYSEAVRNITQAGIIVVASAGNSGPVDYIVGAPSTANDAISVAASVDGSIHNWQHAAVRLLTPDDSRWLVKATEGPVSKPIAQIDDVQGEFVDIGFGDEELSDETKGKLKGNVALVQRGKVAFLVKLQRAAAAGAVGAVVYNNEPGKPLQMGGDGTVNIPAIMVTEAQGLRIKEEMSKGVVRIQFKTPETIEEPDLIDQITEFSSKGPRSEDYLLKPEIAAPGQAIISAAMGQGDGAAKANGTSMAAPHMTGAMALLRERYPDLSPAQLKALAMGTAKILKKDGVQVPITLQGAGRIQVDQALTAPAVVEPAALSLGRVQWNGDRQETRTLTIRNLGKEPLNLTIETEARDGLILSAPERVVVPAEGAADIQVKAQFHLKNLNKFAAELNGHVYFKSDTGVVLQVPALAIRVQSSDVKAELTDGQLSYGNTSSVGGVAMAFNLIGEDSRKATPVPHEAWKSRSCDLQSAGYRILNKNGVDVLQIAFKLYTPMTTWHFCEVTALIDNNDDDIPEQELAGVSAMSIQGVSLPFASVLLDAEKARQIRGQYEQDIAAGKDTPPDYGPAVLNAAPMAPFAHSTVAVIEAPVTKLLTSAQGTLRVKLATLGGGGEVVEADDYLGGGLGQWITLPAQSEKQPYTINEEMTVVESKGSTLPIQRGNTQGKLVIYYPLNPLKEDGDSQSQILEL